MVDRHTKTDGETYAYGPYGYWAPSWRYGRRGRWGGGFYGGWYGDPFWGPWGPYDATFDTIERFNASAEVVMGHGPKPPGDPRAFDARQVMQNLAAKIVRPGETAPPHA